MLCGIIRPKEGEVLFHGENYLQYSIKELGTHIGYVMQNPNQMLVKDMIRDEIEDGVGVLCPVQLFREKTDPL